MDAAEQYDRIVRDYKSCFLKEVVTDNLTILGNGTKSSPLKSVAAKPIGTKSASYTLSLTDYPGGSGTILVNSAAGSVTIGLPPAASATGYMFYIKKLVAANSVIIDPNGAELIDGGATATMTLAQASITIQSDGTAWYIL